MSPIDEIRSALKSEQKGVNDNAYYEPESNSNDNAYYEPEMSPIFGPRLAKQIEAVNEHFADKFSGSTQDDESMAGWAGRLLLSAGAGNLARMGLYMAGLHRVPGIGVPLAIATPFLVSGLASSYQKTGVFNDLQSIGEGALAYGGLGGLGHIARTIEGRAAITMPMMTRSTPIGQLAPSFARGSFIKTF